MFISPDYLLPNWQNALTELASSGRLLTAAQEALQLETIPDSLAELIKQWQTGDFSQLPTVEVLSNESISGAMGAYASSLETIYLNEDWLATASEEDALAVLMEELGHHLDNVVNEKDATGDEGAIFASLLQGKGFGDQVREEDDRATLEINGESVTVEQADNAPPIVEDTTFTIDNESLFSFLGEIVASDPDGDFLEFTIVDGNEDIDGDGIPPFVIDPFENIGEIFVDDIDDLQLADEFFLTVEVSDGEFTDTGTVEINVTAEPTVEVNLELRAIPGQEAQLEDGIQSGDEFLVDVRFLDLVTEDNPSQAVTFGYADLLFDPNVLQVVEDDNTVDGEDGVVDGIVRGPDYITGRTGTVRNLDGIVAEVGGGAVVFGEESFPEENRVFSILFTATEDITPENPTTIESQAVDGIFSGINVLSKPGDQRSQTDFGSLTLPETNNEADLVVTEFDAITDHALNGETTVNFTIENQGNSNTSEFEFDILYYTADNLEQLSQEQPIVVESIVLDELAVGDSVIQTLALSLPLDLLIEEALKDDPPVIGEPLPEEGFFTSNNIDHLGIRINGVEANPIEGVNVDDIAFFPWDFLNLAADGVIQGGSDELISNGEVEQVDFTAVAQNIGEVITEEITEDPLGLDLDRMDFDLDGVISPVDAVRVSNRVGYDINPNAVDDTGETEIPAAGGSVQPSVPEEAVEISISFQDLDGNPIETVNVGEEFEIVLSVEDLREAENLFGVFSIYGDVNYDTNLASILDVEVSESLTVAVGEASINESQGVVDEIGGVNPSGIDDFGVTQTEFAVLTAEATAQGLFEVSTNVGDGVAAFNTVNGFDNDVNANTVYRSETIEVEGGEGGNAPPIIEDTTFTIDPTDDESLSSFLGGIVASDPDGDFLEFTIVDGNEDIDGDEIPPFVIDTFGNDGEIFVDDIDDLQLADEFFLTVEVSDGEFTDTGTVEINVTAEPIVEVNLELRAIPGQEAQLEDGIQSGDEFLVDVRFLDLLTENNPSQAVISGYVDLLFDPSVLEVVEDNSEIDNDGLSVNGIIHTSEYNISRKGEVFNSEGLVDEVGAGDFVGTPSDLPEDNRIFSILFTATEDITPENPTTIESQAGEQSNSGINVLSGRGDQRSQTDFGSLTLPEGELPADLADLVVTEFDAEIDHVLGGETIVNLTVENQGDGTSPGFQVEILYYTADNSEELAEEEPIVVQTLALDELVAGEAVNETSEVSLPIEALLAEALEDDPSIFGEPLPEQGFFTSNNIDHLGIRIIDNPSSNENEETFVNNGVDGIEGKDVDDIAFFPWDFLNNAADGVISGGKDQLTSDGQVTGVDLNAVSGSVGSFIENIEDDRNGLDLAPIDLDLDGAISPVDSVRVGNRVGYLINPEVREVGILPIANNDSGFTEANTPLTLEILNNDQANDSPGGLQITNLPQTTENGGEIQLDNQLRLIYTPNPNFIGVDSFTYTVSNESGNSDEATVDVFVDIPQNPNVQVSLELNPVPGEEAQLEDGIQSGDQFLVDVRFLDLVTEDNPSQAVAQGYVDLSFDSNILQVIENDNTIDAEDGVVDGIIYNPDYNFARQGTVINEEGLVNEVGGGAFVTNSNNFPEDNRIFSILFTATEDITSEDLVSIVSTASGGNLSTITVLSQLEDQRSQTDFGSLTLPETDDNIVDGGGGENVPPEFDQDSFTFETVDLDGEGGDDAQNGDPVGTVTATDANAGDTLTFAITGGNDPDGDGTNAFAIDEASGEVTIVDTAELLGDGFNGELTVTVIDQDGASDEATVSIPVSGPENNPPAAADDSNSTAEDTVLTVEAASVLANDTDPEGDALTVSAVNGGEDNVGTEITLDSGALLTLNVDGSYEYDPNGAFEDLNDGETDTDTFTYTVSDGNGGTDTAMVEITIEGITDNLPPIFDVATEQALDENTALVVAAVASDPDGDDLTFSFSGGADEALFTIDADGNLSFINPPDFENPEDDGEDNVYNVQVSVNDSQETVTEEFAVTINDVDETIPGPPQVVNPINDLTINEGETPNPINLFDVFEDSEDADSELDYRILNTNNALIETALSAGELRFIPFPGSGSTEITVLATDTDDEISNATFTITIDTPPAVVNPIDDRNIPSDSDPIRLNLFETFEDNQDSDSNLSFDVDSKNPNLVSTSFDEARGILFLQLPSNDEGSSKVTVTATDSNGLATEETFLVTVGTSIPTEEPNDTLVTATNTQLDLENQPNVTIAGTIGDNSFESQDIDLYKMTLTQGDRLTADIDTNESSALDSILRIFDSNGLEVALNDDSNGETDSLVTFTVDEAVERATYYIGVSGFSNTSYNPNLENSGTKGSTGAYNLTLTLSSITGEEPANDTIPQAMEIASSLDEEGLFREEAFIGDNAPFQADKDVDLYQVQLQQGETITIDLDTEVNSPLDLILQVFNATGGQVPTGFNDNGTAPEEQKTNTDPYLEFSAPFSGTYYVGVSDQANDLYSPYNPESGQSPGATGAYAINITQDVSREDSPPEASPNDTLDTATALLVGDEIQGNIGDRTEFVTVPGLDVDLYTLTLQGNQAISITLNSTSRLDPVLRLFNAQGEEIAFNDDIGNSNNSRIEFQVPETVETEDYLIGVSGFGNEDYDINEEGSGAPFASTGSYQLIVTEQETPQLEAGAEQENDTLATATPTELTLDNPSLKQTNAIGNNTSLEEVGLDVDLLRVVLDPSTRLTADINTANLDSNLDSLLHIFDENGNSVAFNDDESINSNDSFLEFVPEQAGTYYIGVSGLGNEAYDPNTGEDVKAGRVGEYEIEITLSEAIPEETSNDTRETAIETELTNNRFTREGFIGDNPDVQADVDFYEIDLEAGETLTIEVNGRDSDLESFVELFKGDETDNLLEEKYDAGDFPHPEVSIEIKEDDTYFIRVSSFDDGTDDGKTGEYQLNLGVENAPAAAQAPIEEIRPSVNDDREFTNSDRAVTIDVLANDVANDDQGVNEINDDNFPKTTEKGGTVTVEDSSLIYTPDPDFAGVDTFTYTADNESGGSDQGTVSVTVNRPLEDSTVQVLLDVKPVPGKEEQLNDGLQIGEEFLVDVRFQDLLTDNNPSQAVVAAYADLMFDPQVLEVVENNETVDDEDGLVDGIIRNPSYGLGTKGQVRNEEGLVNEVGGGNLVSSPAALPDDNRVFSLHFRAIGGGNTALLASEAGQRPDSGINIIAGRGDQRDRTNFTRINAIEQITNLDGNNDIAPNLNLAMTNQMVTFQEEGVTGVQGVVEAMEVKVDFQDSAGNPLSEVAVGDTFEIVLSAEDLRPEQLGVFSAFADVVYDTVLIDVNEARLEEPFQSPVIDLSNAIQEGEGLVNEFGGSNSRFNPETGTQKFAIFTATAQAAGLLEVSTKAAEGETALNTLFGIDTDLTEATRYGENTLNIVGESVKGADLVITEFDAEIDHVLGGETTVNLTVANEGDAASSGFQVEVLYYTAESIDQLSEEEPQVVKTLAFDELEAEREVNEQSEVSLPVETLLAEALEDDPSVFGQKRPIDDDGEEGFFESNNIDYLGVRIVNSDNSGEEEEAFANNALNDTEGVNIDDIAFFPWDFVNSSEEGVLPNQDDEIVSDKIVDFNDANAVFRNIGEVITEEVTEGNRFGLDLDRIDFDLDGAISPVDAVRVANRIGYEINPDIFEESVG
ncbi:Ig-like domain-containing protein [Dactylococcopsis salina]|uniref:Pre-peptidase n=1 Tax=Dactylococcopsis salina (strain PCC 8305) TaxID=13035 RepID=K9YZ43_DACS8|nr:Ig-like domain-containing protein [Dactylococcopsis salina]AFZ51398.1 putative pre-peptidase [Dactylococcopsis salina PCC 8305]